MRTKKYFLGIDPSLTGTGVVLLSESGGVIGWELIQTLPKDFTAPVDRKLFISASIKAFLDSNKSSARGSVLAAIESPSFYGKGNNVTLAELYGFLQADLFSDLSGCLGVSPASVKQFLTGGGGATKKDMMFVVSTRLGKEHPITKNDNLSDAYALARVARYVYSLPDAKDRTELISVTKRKDMKPKCSVLF